MFHEAKRRRDRSASGTSLQQQVHAHLQLRDAVAAQVEVRKASGDVLYRGDFVVVQPQLLEGRKRHEFLADRRDAVVLEAEMGEKLQRRNPSRRLQGI